MGASWGCSGIDEEVGRVLQGVAAGVRTGFFAAVRDPLDGNISGVEIKGVYDTDEVDL